MPVVVNSQTMLDKITSTIGELPASPAIVSAVMGLTADLNASVEELGVVLAADATLTAKVLKLSNSSFYGRSRSVSSLREAILILGFYTLRSMVIASSTHSLYSRKDNAKFGQKLWDHSLACGMASRMVARQIRHSRIEEIFIAGLLHDIGKMILGQKLMGIYDQVVKEVEKSGQCFHEVEFAKLGFNHAELGASVLDKWNFPRELVEGVQHHHLIIDEPADIEISIGSVVGYANQLAKQVAAGFEDPNSDDLTLHPFAIRFEFSREDIDTMTDELRTRFVEEKHLFEDN
jgi:putative nucleotidyltransferase with HDIG domain